MPEESNSDGTYGIDENCFPINEVCILDGSAGSTPLPRLTQLLSDRIDRLSDWIEQDGHAGRSISSGGAVQR